MARSSRDAAALLLGLILGLVIARFLPARRLDGTRQNPSPGAVGSANRSGPDGVSSLRRGFSKSKPGAEDGPDDGSAATEMTASPFSQRDVEENERLMRLREEGECVLTMDDPLTRSQLESNWVARGQRSALRRSTDGHPEMYKRLGLTEEQAEKFDRHLSQVEKATAQAEAAIVQLLEARAELGDRMDALLTGEQKEEYRKFEDSLGTKRDIETIAGFMKDRQVPLSDQDLSSISELLVANNASTFRKWGGPFDELPDPAVDTAGISARLSREAADIAATRERVIASARDRGLSQDTLTYLDQYFGWRQQSLEDMAASFADREASATRRNAAQVRLRNELMERSKGK